MKTLKDFQGNIIGYQTEKGENPMLRHGPGPDCTCCESCIHLLKLEYRSKTYYKCKEYGVNHGAGTDFRLSWPTCAKYQEKPKEDKPKKKKRGARKSTEETLETIKNFLSK